MARLSYDVDSGQFIEKKVDLNKVYFGNRQEPKNDIEIPF